MELLELVDLLMAQPTEIIVDQVSFHPPAICTLRVSLSPQRAEQLLRQAGQQDDTRRLQAWLDRVRRVMQDQPLEATGYGVPPASAWRTPHPVWVDVDPPAWVSRTLYVTATVHLPQVERATTDPYAVATAAARI